MTATASPDTSDISNTSGTSHASQASYVASHIAAPVLAEVTQVLHGFFHALDTRRYDRMLAHFTDDCRWLRQGQWLEGKPTVSAALEARALDFDTRHILTNAYVIALDGAWAEVEAYMTAYRYPAPSPSGLPLPTIAGPLRFSLTTTRFRLDAGHDWRICEQRMVAAFGFTG